jgi:hypothetical protein
MAAQREPMKSTESELAFGKLLSHEHLKRIYLRIKDDVLAAVEQAPTPRGQSPVLSFADLSCIL